MDIFSAVLSGANFGPTVIPTLGYLSGDNQSQEDKGIGHFFGAMRVDAFQDKGAFLSQMDHWIEEFRKAEPVAGKERIVIPGDPERELEENHLQNNTIPLMDDVVEKVSETARELGTDFLTD